MPDITKQTLGELLSHKNETIRRNSISIYKTLIAIDKKYPREGICGWKNCKYPCIYDTDYCDRHQTP